MRHFDFIGGVVACAEPGCREVFATREAYEEHWQFAHSEEGDGWTNHEPVCAAHGDMRGA